LLRELVAFYRYMDLRKAGMDPTKGTELDGCILAAEANPLTGRVE
jgi:hypothetical protein